MRNRNAFILAGASVAFAGGLIFLSGNHTAPAPASPAAVLTDDTGTAISRLPQSTTTAVSTLSVPVTVVRTAGAPAQVLPAQRIEVTRVVTLPPVTITRTAEPTTSTTVPPASATSTAQSTAPATE